MILTIPIELHGVSSYPAWLFPRSYPFEDPIVFLRIPPLPIYLLTKYIYFIILTYGLGQGYKIVWVIEALIFGLRPNLPISLSSQPSWRVLYLFLEGYHIWTY